MATKTKRKAVSTRQRFEIFKRDDFTCQYCGAHPPMAVLHCDHIVPVSKGGGNEEENLITACDKCNMGKAAKMLKDAPKSLESKAADVAEREEQIRGYAEVMQAKRERVEQDCWFALEPFLDRFSPDKREIRKDWFGSVRQFVDKLDVFTVYDASILAVSRFPSDEYSAFKYFCGVCWRKIKDDYVCWGKIKDDL